jgi:hypothetical protein
MELTFGYPRIKESTVHGTHILAAYEAAYILKRGKSMEVTKLHSSFRIH